MPRPLSSLVLEATEERARLWETMAAAGHPPDPAEMAAPLLVVPLGRHGPVVASVAFAV